MPQSIDIAEVRSAIARIEDELSRLKASIDTNKSSYAFQRDEHPADLIDVGAAAGLALRNKKTIRAWCGKKENHWPHGFAMKSKGRWRVSRSRFLEHLNG